MAITISSAGYGQQEYGYKQILTTISSAECYRGAVSSVIKIGTMVNNQQDERDKP
jgi:hypothetical protein